MTLGSASHLFSLLLVPRSELRWPQNVCGQKNLLKKPPPISHVIVEEREESGPCK
jgi:hypothetical protein